MAMAGLDGIENKIHPGEPLDKNIYALSAEERKNVPSMPGSLEDALAALEADKDFLLKGDVFTEDAIETWIAYKRENEVDAAPAAAPARVRVLLQLLSDPPAANERAAVIPAAALRPGRSGFRDPASSSDCTAVPTAMIRATTPPIHRIDDPEAPTRYFQRPSSSPRNGSPSPGSSERAWSAARTPRFRSGGS